MWKYGKRLFALLLAFALACAMLPASPAAAAEEAASAPTEAAYAEADAIFDRIDAAENAPAKKNATQAEKTEAAKALVMASDSFVEGSLEQSGNVFTWWTDDGIRCIYNPRMREKRKTMTPDEGVDQIVNEPVATKGGTPAGNQVYLIGPYYGYDDSFTNQYKNEARRVAQAIGDTDGYTVYSGTAATIDKVAEAVSNGAVVFFDSHGATDYENPNDEYDFITGASGSWLCLTSGEGLTDQDYDDGAAYGGEDVFVNGDVIANHMKSNSPSGLLWMAICFGMGTDTMYRPLRAKGVEVVYGYSESVTFAGDYLYEETFWGEMIQGKTVAESITTMKNTWGEWDWSTKIAREYGYYDGYGTIAAARAEFAAFPQVASDEDTVPGQRTGGTNYGADSLQTVRSTYTLGEIFEVTDPTDPGQILTEAYALAPGEELPYEATLTGTITQVTTAYNATYGNVTVIMTVPGYESMPIKCYRLSGSGADQIGVGDTITVTGTIVNYQHSSGDTEVEFTQGCTLVSWTDGGSTTPDIPDQPDTPDTPDVPAGEGVTLSFADKANRTEFSTEKQVWQQNGITVTNEKASSASNVADYYNPARFYKNSSLEIAYPGMIKFEAACTNTDYATALKNSIAGATVTVSGATVTVELPAAADSFYISALSGGQVRVSSITVYAAATAPDVPDVPDEPEIPSVLTADTEVEVTLTEDLYIDLAGYSLTGIIHTNGFKVYCKDSSTDNYDCENIGWFNCLDADGEWIVPELINSDGYKHYLTIHDEDGYSFHRFFVGVTYMSLEPEVIGLGYKAELHGDEMVMAQLDRENAFTFRVQLEGYNPVFRTFSAQDLSDGEPVSLRIRNYAVETHGEHPLLAQVSLHLQDGTTIETEEVSLTFRWLAEQVDTNYTQYTEAQLADFKALLEQFAVVQTWNLPNLFPAEASTATLDFSSTANRLSWGETQQIWTQDGIMLTNNKATSTVAIANYAPIRLYAGSEVIIACAGMQMLLFDCNGLQEKYITAIYDSVASLGDVSRDGGYIFVSLPTSTDSVTFTMTAQGRINTLTVYK